MLWRRPARSLQEPSLLRQPSQADAGSLVGRGLTLRQTFCEYPPVLYAVLYSQNCTPGSAPEHLLRGPAVWFRTTRLCAPQFHVVVELGRSSTTPRPAARTWAERGGGGVAAHGNQLAGAPLSTTARFDRYSRQVSQTTRASNNVRARSPNESFIVSW